MTGTAKPMLTLTGWFSSAVALSLGFAGCGVPAADPATPPVATVTPPGRSEPAPASQSPSSGPARSAALDSPLSVRVLFGHQSVGANIVDGITAAFSTADLAAPTVAEWPADPSDEPAFLHAWIGQNGDPVGKIAAFTSLVRQAGSSIDVALMKFCYIDIVAGTDVEALFKDYSEAMDSLEREFPDVTFLYTTAALTADGAPIVDRSVVEAAAAENSNPSGEPDWDNNIARERFNALVRERYSKTGRLFDIAAIEATVEGDQVRAREHAGRIYYVLNPDLASDDGHLNATGAELLATELFSLIAEVAGD